jgi:hypothetical protein
LKLQVDLRRGYPTRKPWLMPNLHVVAGFSPRLGGQ